MVVEHALGGFDIGEGIEVAHRSLEGGAQSADAVAAEALSALEDGGEGVVVLMRDGIEFVLVAAGAAEREAHEGAAHDVDLLIDHIHAQLVLVRLGEDLGTEIEETGGRDATLAYFDILGLHEIASKLLDHELIKGQIIIEGLHDVVAVTPRGAKRDVFIQTIRVRVTRHIQPVTAPLLAIGMRGQQAVDEIPEG